MTVSTALRHGDFTSLAKAYVHRPAYARTVLKCLSRHVGRERAKLTFADVGAGTGKLTRMLLDLGLSGHAVEPNDAMRQEGVAFCGTDSRIAWIAGRAEQTGLPHGSVDWVTMASSFHWTDASHALAEFHRVLRPGGAFTVLYNPRDLENDPLQKEINDGIKAIVPDLKRVTSAAGDLMRHLDGTLTSSGHFGDLLFVEALHEEQMTPARYMGVWHSVNDIQVQAGPERWKRILSMIERTIAGMDQIVVRYRTRSWTVSVLQ
jgi:ubiquinone/menaquinone biosynthesis C-methylase UbiE